MSRPLDPLPFRPFPLLANPHAQTVLAAFLPRRASPPSELRTIELPDGDRLALEETLPEGWTGRQRTVLLVHGLCGCTESSYLVRMARRLPRRGYRAIRLNLRGCGRGFGLARGIYHSGRSEDVRAVVERLRADHPESPITLIGFSLGGNIVLKLAGELGTRGPDLLRSLISVCPPIDLERCARRIHTGPGRVYEKNFLRLLRRAALERAERFPDIVGPEPPRADSLIDFDDIYTAPHGGFAGAIDYYARSSALPLLPDVHIPTRILWADDDPLVDATVVDGTPVPASVSLHRVPRGGHMGFLALPGPGRPFRWMDDLLERWIEAP